MLCGCPSVRPRFPAPVLSVCGQISRSRTSFLTSKKTHILFFAGSSRLHAACLATGMLTILYTGFRATARCGDKISRMQSVVVALVVLHAVGTSSGGRWTACGQRGDGVPARLYDRPASISALRLRGGTADARMGADRAADGVPATAHRFSAIRVPSDVENVDEAIEMIPGAGDTIEFHEKRHVLDECAIVRWGMRMRVVGARCSAGDGDKQKYPTVAERSEVWGNWTLLQSTMGEWEDLKLGLHCYMSQFTLFDIRGGPWAFARCDTRCIGGIAIELVLRAKLIMTSCGIGGIDSQYMRAQDGLVCRMDSCADLESCCLELCGVLQGYGLQMLEDSRASLAQCRILDNAVGTCVEGNSCLALSNCTLAGNRWAPLYCGATADKVTLTLDTCNLSARCGFVFLNNRRPALLRTRRVQVDHTGPEVEKIEERQGRLEDYNQHPKFHASRERRHAERGRFYGTCQCPTCQQPNVKLQAALNEEVHRTLLGLQRLVSSDEVLVSTAKTLLGNGLHGANDPLTDADLDTDGSSIWEDLSSAVSDCGVQIGVFAHCCSAALLAVVVQEAGAVLEEAKEVMVVEGDFVVNMARLTYCWYGSSEPRIHALLTLHLVLLGSYIQLPQDCPVYSGPVYMRGTYIAATAHLAAL